MKKCYLLLRWPLLITGCAQQTFTVPNKLAAVAPKETITHHCSWNWAEENLPMQPKLHKQKCC